MHLRVPYSNNMGVSYSIIGLYDNMLAQNSGFHFLDPPEGLWHVALRKAALSLTGSLFRMSSKRLDAKEDPKRGKKVDMR